MKFSDEQKEVLALLPQDVRESNELTDAAKLILANLMLLNGTDFAKNEGYLFRTNQALKEDTGIKSEKTIIAAVNKLIELGFIERKAGQRKSASEYRLNTVKIQEYTVKIYCKNKNYSIKLQDKNYSNKLQYKEENTVKNYSNKLQYNNDEISLIINELQNTVKKLQYKITVIEDELLQYKNYSIKNYSENKNYSTDIDIDKEIDTISKDKLLYNNNTEEYNIKDQNIKEKFTTDNLEILKENTKVKSSNDENLNESRIETKDNISDNEIPSDLPPLNIDDFFESSNDNLIEYRSNENNISNELEFSIFGNDIISEDENDKTTVKFIDGKFQVVSETEDEINSSSDVEDNDKINLNLNNMNNSDNTISKVEISNNENNISFEKDNSKVESSKDNFEIWGKLQPVFEKTSNKLVEYLFTEYDNLNDSKNVSDGYHQVKQYISIDKDQIKVSVNQNGSFGILSFKDNVYSFIPCNSNIISDSSDTTSERYHITQSCAAETAETSNNALQAAKMSQVDNYTTDAEKTAPVQPKTANKAYTNPNPNDPKVWEYIKLHLTMKQGSHLMRDVLDEYKEIEAKNIHSVIAYMEDMCKAVRSALEKGLINEMQFNDFKKVFSILSKGKYNYWRKVFSTREPKSLMVSEMKMWGILGKPKVVNGDDETSKVDNNKVYEDNVILPTHKDFGSMNLDDIKNNLLNFVQEHPNLSDDKKAYINNLCIAYAIEPQYVA